MIAPETVLAEARTWLRTPYHHNQRVKGAGVDCAQLLAAVFESVGAIPSIDPQYPPQWHLHRDEERFVAWVESFGDRVEAPVPADVILYKYGRSYSHGALYIGDGQIIHAALNTPVSLASVDEGTLHGRARLFYRLRGIA